MSDYTNFSAPVKPAEAAGREKPLISAPLIIGLILLAAGVYFAARPSAPAVEEPVLEAKSLWQLAEEDRLNLKPALDHLFGPGAEYNLTLLTDGEAAGIKEGAGALASSQGNLFTKVGGQYYYLSKDGQRLYRCLIEAELLSDKIAREKAEAARLAEAAETDRFAADQNEGDGDTMIVYSPSRISGERFEFAKDMTNGGIYLDNDGTWKNF